ncbi:class I SAM-dependent methyltransferase [Paracidovorax konjaci]|uniref:23S rRNA (Cytosine1962-C5)-methyltransferase n=1 Tax=Paracidovorax konjaci TaxID=32040 RepID=A0A1I1WAR2_9BURK|nr:class I SAM-dependent methyltransferase [Paracidovorax konjaci]SFD92202.1 23S rRNA (cytosine1962-C5)-methyltransferase [Paracidovorax konjaci]
MQALLSAIASMPLPTDAVRIFHGRGGRFPGCEQWALDAYPPVFVLTSFAPAAEDELAAVQAALQARWAQIAPAGEPLNWVFQHRGEALRLQGRADTRLMDGSVPEVHTVTENGARYRVHVLKGQNHGLFLDMAEGRRWVQGHVAALCRTRQGGNAEPAGLADPSHGDAAATTATPAAATATAAPRSRRAPKVLNLFAYTCAFSVAALRAGASQVVNVDMGHGAIAIGQQNHRLNGIDHGASFLAHDIFSSWGKITRGGPYDLVIADPPSYQKGSFVATKDYARLVRRLPDLLLPGGHALLCLNAPELDMEFLHALVREHAPGMRFVERVANPAVFADVEEGRALKVGVYVYDGE